MIGNRTSELDNSGTVAMRAHDIAVCLERQTAPDLENIQYLGWAVRLALHLRGIPATSYTMIRDVCIYVLDIPATAVKQVVSLLAEAEFVTIVSEGKTFKTIIPDVPYFDRLYNELGEVSLVNLPLSEPEQLCSVLLGRLAEAPMLEDQAFDLGADRGVTQNVVAIGAQGRFIHSRRARGRSVLLSPAYFPDNQDAYADLVAAQGAGRVKRVLELLQQNPGWPLSLIESQREIGGVSLSNEDIAVAQMLGAEGFTQVPAITTEHQGTNFFLFGPRPGAPRLPAFKKQIYEKAMALVAAVRQGQLLPVAFAIRYPLALLRSLKEKRCLKSTTEAIHQYRALCALGVGRLVRSSGNWYRFELIDLEENLAAVDFAIAIFQGTELPSAVNEDIVLALRAGQQQLDSLIGRKRLLENRTTEVDQETRDAIDEYLLRGAKP